MTFEETMREWRRMCDTETAKGEASCGECPFEDRDGMCGSIFDLDPTKFEEMAGLIKHWSDTHPKPQYPTWGEWFLRTCQVSITPNGYNNWDKLLGSQIPAEIAEKLGVDPL